MYFETLKLLFFEQRDAKWEHAIPRAEFPGRRGSRRNGRGGRYHRYIYFHIKMN